jgi:glycosyltransferase involved in cell wall biosynthesis
VARGHEVRVQTAALGLRSSREEICGVAVFRTASLRRVPDTCGVHEMALYCATSFFPTLRHIHRWKPAVIHAHFAVPTGALAWAMHGLTGVPYVITAHLGDVPGGVPEQTDTLFRMIDPLARRIWKSAAAITAVSSFVQELAERAYQRPVQRILNGIDLQQGEESPPEKLGEPRQLVFVGRFNPQKNPLFLIDALAQLTRLDWQLTMIGDGPLLPSVSERVGNIDLSARVHLLGWLDAAQVQAVLARSDILCMPSLSEGLPVAAVEALASALAIVASDIPGVRDVVSHGVNGLTAPLLDLPAFTDRLRLLLEDPATLLRMKRASREKARAFALPEIVDQYERVLEAATSSGERNSAIDSSLL